jgi:KUP system potassium uptake protein
VSVKYLLFVLRADNQGEGGILALVALVRSKTVAHGRGTLIAVGLFGAALWRRHDYPGNLRTQRR